MAHACDDPYCMALEEAKERIEKNSCPDGLADWLRVNERNLYREFYADIPCTIETLWLQKAPLGEFNNVLDGWVKTFTAAVERYEGREKLETN